MDFFAHQDLARRNTHWLVIYFALAVVFIVLGVYLAVILIFFGIEAKTGFELSGHALRAVSDSLDCPMPPFLAGQELDQPGQDGIGG